MNDIYDKLKEYAGQGIYPFHMPGHKRNFPAVPFLDMDITELPGFDNLHHPTGIIREAELHAAELFGAEESFLLINGATAGVMAAVLCAAGDGGEIAMPVNCHKSVYSALIISGARPRFFLPENLPELYVFGGVSPEKAEALLSENPEIRAVLVTSPTYEGFVSDITALSQICHRRGVPLIVDEAHGAHMCFSHYFPKPALECGADVVIHGLHKTLPFPTQVAAVHVQGSLIDRERLKSLLAMLQSSSPSYLLMGAADKALSVLSESGKELFSEYVGNLIEFRKKAEALSAVYLIGEEYIRRKGILDYDPGKLILCGRRYGVSSRVLTEKLLSRGIQAEAAGIFHVTAMTSICDTKEGFAKLLSALSEIRPGNCDPKFLFEAALPQMVMTPKEGFYSAREKVELSGAAGRVAADFVTPYPPGVPLLVPGQQVTEKIIEQIGVFKDAGLEFLGTDGDMISVTV